MNHYQYDLNGNLIQSGSREFTYDALNRLIAIKDGEHVYRYTYDPFNRRLSKNIDGVTTNYLYQGQDEIGALQSGAITELRVLGNGKGAEVSAAVSVELNGKPYVPLHDLHGNVSYLIDPTSDQPAGKYEFTAFGEETCAGILSPWRFSSKRLDEETGYVYFGRRYYAPGLGKWITADPAGYEDGPNLYAYVKNSPLIHFDLYGLWRTRTKEERCGESRWCKYNGRKKDIANLNGQACQQENLLASISEGEKRKLIESLTHEKQFANYEANVGFCFSVGVVLYRAYRIYKVYRTAKTIEKIINSKPEVEIKPAETLNLAETSNSACQSIKCTPNKINYSIVRGDKVYEGEADIAQTLARIRRGEKNPHKNDGIVYRNEKETLPLKDLNYYREYVIPTDGIKGAGPQRLVVGKCNEIYYTPNHYNSFIKVKID